MIDIENLKCNYCDKTYSVLSSLKLHCQTGQNHAENVLKSGIPQPDPNTIKKIKIPVIANNNRLERNDKVIYDKKTCKVPLNSEVYVILDIFVWEMICQYRLTYCKIYGYVHIVINDKVYRLHRYIYYNLFHRVPRIGKYVDHENRNRVDARIENLREVTASENNRNRTKSDNCSSIYKGVCYDKKSDKWVCQLKLDNKTLSFRYDNELHAAYHYNLFVIEAGLAYCCPLNEVEPPEDFIKKVSIKKKKNDLPIGIEKHRQKYRYQFHGKYSHVFKTIEEAVNDRNQKIEQEKIEKYNKLINEPIQRNGDGIPIIKVFSEKKQKYTEFKVDAHRYHELRFGSIYEAKGYANININNIHARLSRYLLNCNDKTKYVDHKDNDKSNYQINNLKIVSFLHNAQNKSSHGSTSNYTGVSYDSKCKKWMVSINNKPSQKTYKTEYKAVIVRDMKAYELNLLGNYFKINLPVELQVNLFIKSLTQDDFDFNYLFY